MYFDVNNLYGWAMSEFLPYGEFQWVDDIERFDVMSVSSDSVVGYILEVDLAYSQNVHDVQTFHSAPIANGLPENGMTNYWPLFTIRSAISCTIAIYNNVYSAWITRKKNSSNITIRTIPMASRIY